MMNLENMWIYIGITFKGYIHLSIDWASARGGGGGGGGVTDYLELLSCSAIFGHF